MAIKHCKQMIKKCSNNLTQRQYCVFKWIRKHRITRENAAKSYPRETDNVKIKEP